ncbi:envelope-like protein [Cucumis melo var. makuwa]|uniref:Envelope-like protein n=1 Tax=Cucumis melo var. makuwa TaxID=1194695 RepID=A0A5D3CH98_CUCMM|nr:envelope-like protein [Cucumis melo var. makuwa]
MVNTRKGNYAVKSSKEVHDALALKSAMHGVRMRGRCFKDDVGTGSALKDAEIALSVSETHISDMDSDDLDNVPLARLMKKNSVPRVAAEKSIDFIVSIHYQESSSSEGVFVSTNGLHIQVHASNVEPGPSHHSSPIRSSVPDNVPTSNTDVEPTPSFLLNLLRLKDGLMNPLLMMKTLLNLSTLASTMMRSLLMKMLHQMFIMILNLRLIFFPKTAGSPWNKEDSRQQRLMVRLPLNVKVKGRRFKSTLPRRSYRLSSEKSQEEASNKFHESVLLESVSVVGESSVPASSVAYAPQVPATTVSDIDSDDQDDVPLARLLKRTLILHVSDKLPIDPLNSIHSQERPSARSPPASPPPFATVDDYESVPDDVSGDISAALVR